jgi:predicted enzyme related to lactoylglutathione lyase
VAIVKGGKRDNSGRKPTGKQPYQRIYINQDLQEKIKKIEPEGKTLLKKIKNIINKI